MIALAIFGLIAVVTVLSSGACAPIAWNMGKKAKFLEVSKTTGFLVSLVTIVLFVFFVSFLVSYLFNGLNWVVGGETTIGMYVDAAKFIAHRALIVAVPIVCLCFYWSVHDNGVRQ